MRLDATLLAIAFAAVLAWMYVRNRNRVRDDRARIFDDCVTLFSDIEITQDHINFPVLTGRYGDLDVKLEPLVDHIAVRKIPSLWLMVTVKTPIPHKGSLDYLVRPQNIEFYSPASQLMTAVDIPPTWPQHAVLRTNSVRQMPPLDIVGAHIGMFDEPKMKELLITPRGVRVVYQLDQAARSYYMVLRQLRFENFIIDPQLAEHLLGLAIGVAEDLQNVSSTPNRITADG